MAQIFKNLVEGDSKGVKKDDFQRLRVQVGIARELAMDAERKKARLEKEAKMEEMKKEVQGSIDAAAEAAKATGELVDKVQAASKEVFGKAMKLDVEELGKEAEELDKLLEEAKTSIEKSKEIVTGLLEDVDEDIKAWMTQKAGEVKGRINIRTQRLGKLAGSPGKLRDIAKRKEIAEMEALEAKALSFLRYHQKETKLSRDELFKAVDANKDGKISEADFVKFFVTCKRPPKPQDPKAKADADADGEEELDTAPDDAGLQKVFKNLVDGDKDFLTKERFASVVRHLMKVATVSVLSKELKADSEAVRKLEAREVVEVLEGPIEDEASKTKRVKVTAMRDGAVGYVTLTGNGGTVFLRDGGRLFKEPAELHGAYQIPHRPTAAAVSPVDPRGCWVDELCRRLADAPARLVVLAGEAPDSEIQALRDAARQVGAHVASVSPLLGSGLPLEGGHATLTAEVTPEAVDARVASAVELWWLSSSDTVFSLGLLGGSPVGVLDAVEAPLSVGASVALPGRAVEAAAGVWHLWASIQDELDATMPLLVSDRCSWLLGASVGLAAQLRAEPALCRGFREEDGFCRTGYFAAEVVVSVLRPEPAMSKVDIGKEAVTAVVKDGA
ncbi:unnamed protein product [Prorocentrum cordatum]|uniref:EF-hand domain-containing protein n=1 Tax=Prorocentrum cordatum TaxID=2364126 RepID=A0ABN9X9H7_9DINO|nr:unnamed protein product [Polarella glacialis]